MDSMFLSVLSPVVFALIYVASSELEQRVRLGVSTVSAFVAVIVAYLVTLSDFYGEVNASLFSSFLDDLFVFATVLILGSASLFVVLSLLTGGADG